MPELPVVSGRDARRAAAWLGVCPPEREPHDPAPSWAHRISADSRRVPFRRQVVIGSHVADFVAASIRLVVEVDGGYHASHRAADARRDVKFRRLGYHVLRFEADLVERDLPRAVALLREAVERLR